MASTLDPDQEEQEAGKRSETTRSLATSGGGPGEKATRCGACLTYGVGPLSVSSRRPVERHAAFRLIRPPAAAIC